MLQDNWLLTGPCTVTVDEQVALLPCISVTVSNTLLLPMSVVVKVDFDKPVLAIPQLSVLPLFTWAGVIVAVPFTNVTVMLLHIATGASLSTTVIVNEQEFVLPDASVTVYVSVVVPTGNTASLPRPAVRAVVAPAQLSVPTGAV